ncbi:zinc ABC transporter substrate-binding protein [Nitratifractor sp.]|uniref:metal ABC transporter solute-binding protein, Zn/Mn family n=1 Tax=Nitratifractor sp. TaxID=2268144 RepID=UPI0025CE397A|nr:zinc ABC transporter substrate-binding protein [Nitratifractor sp.]
MKLRFVFFSLLLIMLQAQAKLNIIVSIPPEKYFVEQIAKDHARVTVMVPPGSSPHTYEPKASQMRAVGDADLYFAIGVEFERAWLPRFRSQNPNLTIVDLSRAVQKIPMTGGHAEHGEQHTSGDEHGHEEHGLDPHIWLSVRNVRKMAPLIEKTLESKDPSHVAEYRKNLADFEKNLQTLDQQIRKILSPLPKGSAFMVVHPSWGYFARDYGLRQMPVEIEGKAPKPRQLMQLIDAAKREKIRAIFVQPEFSDKSARLLAAELGIPVLKISPLAENWNDTLLRLSRALAGEQRP